MNISSRCFDIQEFYNDSEVLTWNYLTDGHWIMKLWLPRGQLAD